MTIAAGIQAAGSAAGAMLNRAGKEFQAALQEQINLNAGLPQVKAQQTTPTPQPLQPGEERPLTQGEIALAREVFGDEIDYSQVRVKYSSFLPFGMQQGNVAMSPDGNIYFSPNGSLYRDDYSAANIDMQALFIHEMAHVWQHQNGANLLGDAIGGWISTGGNYNALYSYDFDRCRSFESYNFEQQADMARHYFLLRRGVEVDTGGSLADYANMLPFVEDVAPTGTAEACPTPAPTVTAGPVPTAPVEPVTPTPTPVRTATATPNAEPGIEYIPAPAPTPEGQG